MKQLDDERQHDLGQIADLITDELTPDGAARVRDRVEHDGQFQRLAVPVLAAWVVGRVESRVSDEEARVSLIKRMAQIDRAHVVRSSVAYRRRWIAGPLVGLAAAALFFVSLTTVPMGRWLLARVVGVQADFDIRTTVGEQRSILLADGSRVTIEPDSRLSYRASLVEPAQLLTLQGAATFDVVPQHFRKFRVAGGRIFVEVEGTRFGVRAYADEPEASVSVSRGRVRVAGPDFRDVQVDSGFAARVVNRTVQIQRVPQGVISWNGQELEFNSVPLGTIVATLRHWDGSRIRLADAELAAKVLTVTTTLTDSGTVAALQSFMHVSARWDGDSVLVYDPARR